MQCGEQYPSQVTKVSSPPLVNPTIEVANRRCDLWARTATKGLFLLG
jgi:hypothetical protein